MSEQEKNKSWSPFDFPWNFTVAQLQFLYNCNHLVEATEKNCPCAPKTSTGTQLSCQFFSRVTRERILFYFYEHWKSRQEELEKLLHATFDSQLQEEAAIRAAKRARRNISLCGVMIGVRFQDKWRGWHRIFRIVDKTKHGCSFQARLESVQPLPETIQKKMRLLEAKKHKEEKSQQPPSDFPSSWLSFSQLRCAQDTQDRFRGILPLPPTKELPRNLTDENTAPIETMDIWEEIVKTQVGNIHTFRNFSPGKSFFSNSEIKTLSPSNRYNPKTNTFEALPYTRLIESEAEAEIEKETTIRNIPFFLLRFVGGGEVNETVFPLRDLSSSSSSSSSDEVKLRTLEFAETDTPEWTLDMAPVGCFTQVCAWMQLCSNNQVTPSIGYLIMEYITSDWSERFLTPIPAYWNREKKKPTAATKRLASTGTAEAMDESKEGSKKNNKETKKRKASQEKPCDTNKKPKTTPKDSAASQPELVAGDRTEGLGRPDKPTVQDIPSARRSHRVKCAVVHHPLDEMEE